MLTRLSENRQSGWRVDSGVALMHTTTRVYRRATAWVDRGRACWMEWLDLVPLVAALATMALALTALTAGTELARWLIDVALQTAVVLGFDAGTGRALTNYSEEL